MTTAEAPSEPDQLVRVWRGYSRKVYGSYSPLNAALAQAVSESDGLLEFLRLQPPHAHDPNMLLAGIQFLVLGGVEHPLAALYGANGGQVKPRGLRSQLEDFCERFEADLSAILTTRRIQTNEVGRSAGLALGLACAARSLGGEPVALVDAGASAGLNLLLDEYRLRYGNGGEIGPSSSAVVIDCRVEPENMRLPDRLPAISRRMGLDRNPVDLADEENVRWLLACIWPGTGRHERTASAIELATQKPPGVVRGDMVADLGSAIASVRPGPVVVVTSWSFSYLGEDDRRAFERVLRDAGQEGPVAWICCDSPGVSDLFKPADPPPDDGDIPSVLGLAVFESDLVESHCLGYMHSHGRWVKWLEPSVTPAFP